VARLKISRGGQVSVPAEIRHRWSSSMLTLEDHGDHVVLRPSANDPVAAARGALKDQAGGLTSEDMRREARDEDDEQERRRRGAA
jgi:bifunctional DNA-binding transcriptional regulator/antitoxin component of YhaV-PrlF toxin-antitoxin module